MGCERLDRVRFSTERELIDLLYERYGLDEVLRRFFEQQPSAPWYELVVSQQVRLTPLIAPRLTGLLDEVCQRLDFDEPVELFVEPSADINGFALHRISTGKPHVISLTSGLVERMTDSEICFVLGHELGHLRYRHYKSRMVKVVLTGEENRLPPLLERRLETWDRLAELSADRAGYAAVDGDLNAIVSAFFKMASGLGPAHLKYDINAFLGQLEEIQRIERRDLLARFSHPATPVRVRALQVFGESGGFDAGPDELAEVDHRVAEVAQLMEYQAVEPLDVAVRDFMIAGGLLVTHVDGTPASDSQRLVLLLALLPLCADPEASVAAIDNAEEAREVLKRSAVWLLENAGDEGFTAYIQLAHIAALDGELHPDEEALMLEIAESVGISAKRAQEILYDALTSYLQTQASTKTPAHDFEMGAMRTSKGISTPG
jgi:Zn-dependent protease with chaperone function